MSVNSLVQGQGMGEVLGGVVEPDGAELGL